MCLVFDLSYKSGVPCILCSLYPMSFKFDVSCIRRSLYLLFVASGVPCVLCSLYPMFLSSDVPCRPNRCDCEYCPCLWHNPSPTVVFKVVLLRDDPYFRNPLKESLSY